MFSKFLSVLLVIVVLLSKSMVAYSVEPIAPLSEEVLADKTYSLSDRYSNTYVNTVFANNILLTLAYMRGEAKDGQKVDWNNVKENFSYTLTLKAGQTFAFHDALLPEYKDKVFETTHAHFNSQEGFESDGWLVGDGVCHLASFMNVVAREAHLQVDSPTPHNFATIADVPAKYGVAIYYMPGEETASSMQNLYITNTFSTPIAFVFTHKGNALNIHVEKNS